MRYSLLATELLLAGTACATLELQVQKHHRHNHARNSNVARGLTTRGGTLETTLFPGLGWVSGGSYYTNITVGTPPQLLTVLLDTGSSDLYVDVASGCPSPNSAHPCDGGTFSPSDSSTLNVLPGNTAFNATYGDGSRAVGPYAQDTVCIRDICIDNVQFGLAEDIVSTVGPAISLMGVGPSVIEASQYEYPNIPWVLVESGVINSRLYSLWLNDYDGLTGSILFGGIDTDKYTGTLQTTDTLPDPITGYVDQFITSITALKANVNGKSKSIFAGGNPGRAAYGQNTVSLPVLLDSGSSAWSVPQSYYEAIVREFPYVDPKNGIGSCKYAYSGDSLTLTVNAAVEITVDISEFFLPLYNSNTDEPEMISSTEQACGFSIVPSAGTGEGFDTMGDAMLRSMYVVYDLDLGQMSIAQSKQNSTSSNVIAVQAGLGGVAKAAGGSGSNAPPQSYKIAPSLSIPASASYAVSTAQSAVGTATGIAAIPTAARVSGEGSGSGSNGGSSSHNAAAAALPPMQWGGLGSAAMAMAMVLFGAAFML